MKETRLYDQHGNWLNKPPDPPEEKLVVDQMPGDPYVPLGPGDPHVEGVFTSVISDRDRERLRKIIRKVHFANYPTDMLTDYECDKLINAWGPKVAAYEIKKHMDRGDVE